MLKIARIGRARENLLDSEVSTGTPARGSGAPWGRRATSFSILDASTQSWTRHWLLTTGGKKTSPSVRRCLHGILERGFYDNLHRLAGRRWGDVGRQRSPTGLRQQQ